MLVGYVICTEASTVLDMDSYIIVYRTPWSKIPLHFTVIDVAKIVQYYLRNSASCPVLDTKKNYPWIAGSRDPHVTGTESDVTQVAHPVSCTSFVRVLNLTQWTVNIHNDASATADE